MDKHKLAKHIHDGLSQMLTVVSMNLTILSSEAERFDQEKKSIYKETQDLVNRAVEESRKISRELIKDE